MTPRLTRDQCQAAIQGPAAVFGSRVEADVVTHLLNEMSTNPDQLPVLQHCLMRMWQHALKRHGKDDTDFESISFPQGIELSWVDYETVGTLQHAMSQHGEEALQEVRDKFGKVQAEHISEYFFRALVEVTTNRRDMRRPPVSFEQIAAETAIPQAQLQSLVEIFSSPRFGFIQVYQRNEILSETKICITHESLIHLWEQLENWREEEEAAVEKYKHLEHVARQWRKKKDDLLNKLSLANTQSWIDREKPSIEWFKRYGSDFELAMEFFQKSITNEKNRRRIRIVTALSILLVLLSTLFIVYHQWQRELAARDTFQKMVSATFDFLSESGQNSSFLKWAQKTSTIERLTSALDLMIELSESMTRDEKDYWHQELLKMDEGQKLILLDILGAETSKKDEP